MSDEDLYHGASERWFTSGGLDVALTPERPLAASVREPERDTPVHAVADVLVVGGGPAGCAAALAARRLGAEVLLVERYNHLGGLSTGGLVVWIDRMSDWTGRQVITGSGPSSCSGSHPRRSRALRPSCGDHRQSRPSPTGANVKGLFVAW